MSVQPRWYACHNAECVYFEQWRRVDPLWLGPDMLTWPSAPSCACTPDVEMRRVTGTIEYITEVEKPWPTLKEGDLLGVATKLDGTEVEVRVGRRIKAETAQDFAIRLDGSTVPPIATS